ncbi:MAG: tetratricopeptide repeat protein [Sneathiellaceae bacterium]
MAPRTKEPDGAAALALAEARQALDRKELEAAVTAFAKARELGAPLERVARDHALALSGLDRHDEAVEAFRPWFAKRRKDSEVQNLMGVLLKRAGRLRQAAEVLERARLLRPKDLSPWQNLGNVHRQLGDHRLAARYFRGALAINPGSPELWRLLGRSLAASGKPGEALAAYRRGLDRSPANRQLTALYLQALLQSGQVAEATAFIADLRNAHPEDPEIAVLEARLVFRTGDAERAVTLLHGILAQHPDNLSANLQLATIVGDSDRRAANQALERAVAAHPGSFDALDRLIDSLSRSRYDSETVHVERAYALARKLMERFPSRIPEAARTLRTILMRVLDEERMPATGSLRQLLPIWLGEGRHSSALYELGQVASMEDRLALVDWHRDWGRKASAGIRPVSLPAMPALATGRKLRIGFMSSDLRHHPVTYFALPLLEGFDAERVEVFCYSFDEKPTDRVREHIAATVTAFRHWPRQSNAFVAENIARDGLDILFELGASTAMNKLEVMAYRPARIGASWVGYPHSAGLEQIDYILTDPYTTPEDPRLLIERPFEMPETWVTLSRMFTEQEIADGTPAQRKGHLTFGTANNPYKYTRFCLDAWAAVLRAVPGSRFLFLRPEADAPSFVANSRAAFARRDVDPDRLAYIGVRGKHIPHYNEIDIALDTLPHTGGTTTCEALWMGVPTVTLVGPGFTERLSYSNLSNTGLGDLAAASVADYVAKAAELAADPARRLALRHGLRARIRSHPLGQPERFARHFYELAARVAAE